MTSVSYFSKQQESLFHKHSGVKSILKLLISKSIISHGKLLELKNTGLLKTNYSIVSKKLVILKLQVKVFFRHFSPEMTTGSKK